MRVELYKEIVSDGWGEIEPLAYPRRSRQVVTCDFPGFQARHKAFAETHADRSGNHEQVALSPSAGCGFNSAIERSRTAVSVVCAPVDLVHNSSLGRGGKRRHGEPRLPAEIAEQGDLAIEAARRTVRVRIIKRPVAMNKAKGGASILASKQPRSEEHTSELQS